MGQPRYDEIIWHSGLTALKLDIEVPHEALHAELKALHDTFVAQIGNENWQGATLRGLSSSQPRPYYEYGYESEDHVPYVWTDEATRCPATRAFIERVFAGAPLYRVKVNLLKPKGRIHLHNDSKTSGLGISDKTSSQDATFVTIAVYWPEEVIFNLGSRRLPIKTGDAWLLDFSQYHEVFNPTEFDRYYLLVTGKLKQSNTWIETVERSFDANRYIKLPSAVRF